MTLVRGIFGTSPWSLGLTIATMVAGGVVALILADVIRDSLTKVFGEVAAEALRGTVPWLPALAVMFGGIAWCEIKSRGVANMCCPGCRKCPAL